MERELYFDGIRNARDLGGIWTMDNRMIRSHRLIRSAMLGNTRPEDIHKLKYECRVINIIDLRTPQEIREKPDVMINGINYYSLPIFSAPISGISHEQNSKLLKEVDGLAGLYQKMVLNEECMENIRRVLLLIFNNDFEKGSVLWHCTEGKDRCGLISAFVLRILGVDLETIMADYLMTNINNEPKAIRYYENIIKMGKSEKEAAEVRDMYLAKKEYLDAAFKAIDIQYKNFGNYLLNGLKINYDIVNSFREKVLD